jgi:hypothetical protein
VGALSLLSTDLQLDPVGYVHRYTASPADAAADYNNDGRVSPQDVTQELAGLIGTQDPRFQLLLTAYMSFSANRLQYGQAAAVQKFREGLEDHCRSNGSSTGSVAASPEDDPSDDAGSDESDGATDPSAADDGDGTDPQSLPDGLFCRDLNARGLSYDDAVAYYIAQGRPDRMDKDLNGIPCETVYSPAEVKAYIDANGEP